MYRSVAYFNASGPVPLARLHGSESYQSYMLDTLPGASQSRDLEEIRETIKKTLSDIRDEARAIKGDLIGLGAISYPAHFDYTAINTLIDAAVDFDKGLNNFIRFRPAHYAMLTYPPGYCSETYGQEDPTYGDDAPLVLMFEHDFNRLRISLALTSNYGTSIYHEDRLPWPTHQRKIEDIIRKQLKEHNLDEIPTVILSSDGASMDLSQIPAALAATFPELVPKIQIPVGGSQYVTSIGAACVARQLALLPDFRRHGEPDEPDQAELHDEL